MAKLLDRIPEQKPSIPPEERFWERYSSRHELPLSGMGSLTLHGLGIAAIVFLAIGAIRLGQAGSRLGVETVTLGVNDEPGKPAETVLPDREDLSRESSGPAQVALTPRPELTVPATVPMEVQFPESVQKRDGAGLIGELVKEANKRRSKRPSSGTKDGPNDNSSPVGRHDVAPTIPPHLRWQLTFDTRFNGDEYLKQLQYFNGAMAIPTGPGDPPPGYLVLRDLHRRPAVLVPGDVSSFTGIAWVDARPESVHSVMRALRIDLQPERIVVFFPPRFEARLRQLERDYSGNLPVEHIAATEFKVRRSGQGYEPYVAGQTPR